MRRIERIAVFCGSNVGSTPAFADGAAALGRAMAARGIALVYGGTHKGLMGALADAVLEGGGAAHGVITASLHGRGHLHPRLTGHEIVETLRLRKDRMAEMADAFVALPGGIGTLEEFLEVWTRNQLGEFDKPAGLFDVDGYYRPFLAFIDHMVERAFLPGAHRGAIAVAGEAEALLDDLKRLEPVTVPKWL